MIVATVDIGSTWTKGATFKISGDEVEILQRAARPTTVSNLADGFFAVLGEIVSGDPLSLIRAGQINLQYSSSAKGGLAVAAIGLVPEVTLEIGKIAAQSAGAKLTQVFSYQLTRSDIAGLETSPPDILLFAGGTDGGNTRYLLDNARAIANSAIDCEIVYAGNRAVADEVAEILAKKRLRVVDNLLPSFDEPNPDPARDAIRTIFLDTIVKGKGLDVIMEATGSAPAPTPFAVLEYVRAIRDHVPGWEDFVLFDLGGATTDVYSAHKETPEAGTLLRGLPEPEVKRTVEGDLGMRVSAQSTSRINTQEMEKAVARTSSSKEALTQHADLLVAQPDFLPTSEQDQHLDTLLAGLCIGHACARHAGRSSPVFTQEGEVQLQTGRDLRRVAKVIGSGGWLARAKDFNPAPWFADHTIDHRGRSVLVPRHFAYYRDTDYLFPLLANLARTFPHAAAHAGINRLSAPSSNTMNSQNTL
ncbi:MAG: methylaspartate mutase accessory protein GlmL [Betaproteobacteria bacterium]